MSGLCKKCEKEPIYLKKRSLCKECSRRFYYEQNRDVLLQKRKLTYWEVRHSTEVEFIRNFFEHKNWIYHPAIFRVNGKNYEPDFYDAERNVFIEVTGTRQAFEGNKEKYQCFIKTYPLIKFEIRYTTGELLPLKEMKYHVLEKR